jgi:hypothetical protein
MKITLSLRRILNSMKKIAIGIAAAALLVAAAEKQTFTGLITDSECAKGDHKAMNMGPSDAKCVLECVKGMGGKYVLYDGKETYELSDQKNAEKFAAKKVTVKGTLEPKTKTIHVDSMMAAK